MAIEEIADGEGGKSARDKLNAAIAQANLVAGKADATDVAVLELALAAKADAETLTGLAATVGQKAAVVDLAAETAARQAGDAGLRRSVVAVMGYAGRLAEMGILATAETAGAPDAVTPLASNAYAVSDKDGSVVVLSGAATVAPIALTRIEPGRVYRARYQMRRVADTMDPPGDVLRLALHWHDARVTPLPPQTLADLADVTVASGLVAHEFVFALADDGGVDAVAPAGGVYARPFIRSFGSGVSHALLAQIEDITGAVDWSPDVTVFRNAVAGLAQLQDMQAGQLSSLDAAVTAMVARNEQAAFALVNSDADFAISVSADAKAIRHTATLTQPRTATLIAGGAIAGSRCRITRTGGGAYALNVFGAGLLKSMATGTWAEFTFDGAAWFLAASGAL